MYYSNPTKSQLWVRFFCLYSQLCCKNSSLGNAVSVTSYDYFPAVTFGSSSHDSSFTFFLSSTSSSYSTLAAFPTLIQACDSALTVSRPHQSPTLYCFISFHPRQSFLSFSYYSLATFTLVNL